MSTKILTYGFALSAVVLFPLISVVASMYAPELRIVLGNTFDALLGSLPAVRAIASSPTFDAAPDPVASTSSEASAMVRAASVICALALSVVVMGTIHLVLCICATRKQKSKGGSRAGTAKEWRYYVFWLIGILAAAGCLSYGMTSDTLIRRSGIVEGFPLWWIKLCLLNTGALWCVLGVSETLCVRENRVARVDLRR